MGFALVVGPHDLTEAEARVWTSIKRRIRVGGVQVDGVLPPDICWVWCGTRDAWGYARFKLRGRSRPVHRLLFTMFVGSFPSDHYLVRRESACSDDACVNPVHFEPTPRWAKLAGTAAANASKTHCPQGHPLEGANLYYATRKRGVARVCRTCDQDKKRSAGAGQETEGTAVAL